MSNTRRALQPVIELDEVPRSQWRFEHGPRYLWNHRLWTVEKVGCVLCVEDDNAATLSTVDGGPPLFLCMEHGALCEVPYAVRKVYTVRIGDIEREGEETLDDSMLFPAEMTLGHRNTLIEKLLDEAQQEEAAAGPVPTD